MRAQLLGLVPAFTEAGVAIEAAITTAEEAARRAAENALSMAKKALDDAMRTSKDFAAIREDLLKGTLSPLSKQQQATWTGKQFNTLFDRAKGGDKEALSGLPKASREYLESALQTATSAEDYTRSFAEMQIKMHEAERESALQVDFAQAQYDQVKEQTSILLDIDEGVTTLAEALLDYQEKLAELDRAKGRRSDDLFSSVPQFASGGLHRGGIRLVGERGPELEVTGPSRIYSAEQTRRMFGGSEPLNDRLISEIVALRSEVAQLRAATEATAINTHEAKKQIQRWDQDGMPETRT
jgi:hypothetical protein